MAAARDEWIHLLSQEVASVKEYYDRKLSHIGYLGFAVTGALAFLLSRIEPLVDPAGEAEPVNLGALVSSLIVAGILLYWLVHSIWVLFVHWEAKEKPLGGLDRVANPWEPVLFSKLVGFLYLVAAMLVFVQNDDRGTLVRAVSMILAYGLLLVEMFNQGKIQLYTEAGPRKLATFEQGLTRIESSIRSMESYGWGTALFTNQLRAKLVRDKAQLARLRGNLDPSVRRAFFRQQLLIRSVFALGSLLAISWIVPFRGLAFYEAFASFTLFLLLLQLFVFLLVDYDNDIYRKLIILRQNLAEGQIPVEHASEAYAAVYRGSVKSQELKVHDATMLPLLDMAGARYHFVVEVPPTVVAALNAPNDPAG